MSDISKCMGTNCPLKKTCYRFLAEPSPIRQSYFSMVPYNKETGKCDHYWQNVKMNKK
jgi:hypothetical protein